MSGLFMKKIQWLKLCKIFHWLYKLEIGFIAINVYYISTNYSCLCTYDYVTIYGDTGIDYKKILLENKIVCVTVLVSYNINLKLFDS